MPSEIQKIGAGGMMQNEKQISCMSHTIEMIDVERGRLNKYGRRNGENLQTGPSKAFNFVEV